MILFDKKPSVESYRINDSLSLRLVEESDIPILIELIQTNLKAFAKAGVFNNNFNEKKYKKDVLHSKDDITFVILWKDKVVGSTAIGWEKGYVPSWIYKNGSRYIGYTRHEKPASGSTWIRPELQGKGIGSAVGQFLIDWVFSQTDCDAFFKHCLNTNDISQKSILKQGFRFIKEWCVEDNVLTHVITRDEWIEKQLYSKLG